MPKPKNKTDTAQNTPQGTTNTGVAVSSGDAIPPQDDAIISSGGYLASVTYEMVRGMINDSEDRSKERLATLESQINNKLDGMPGYKTIWGAAVTGILSIAGIIAGLYAFGSDRFESGIERGSVVAERLNGFQSQLNQSSSGQSNQTDEILKAVQDIRLRLDKDASTK